MTLLRASLAPAPRTLVDILRETVERHPDATALDNGREQLTYVEFLDAAGKTITIPKNATVAFATGTCIYVSQTGAGQVTVAAASLAAPEFQPISSTP